MKVDKAKLEQNLLLELREIGLKELGDIAPIYELLDVVVKDIQNIEKLQDTFLVNVIGEVSCNLKEIGQETFPYNGTIEINSTTNDIVRILESQLNISSFYE